MQIKNKEREQYRMALTVRSCACQPRANACCHCCEHWCMYYSHCNESEQLLMWEWNEKGHWERAAIPWWERDVPDRRRPTRPPCSHRICAQQLLLYFCGHQIALSPLPLTHFTIHRSSNPVSNKSSLIQWKNGIPSYPYGNGQHNKYYSWMETENYLSPPSIQCVS